MTEVYNYLSILHVLWFALGGAFGAALRYCASQALAPFSQQWPVSTWVVNVLGAFLLGFIAAYFNDYGYSPGFLFWELGVLGGFTTMSTFAVEHLNLLRAQRYAAAISYMLGSGLGALGAIMLGFTLGGLVS